jgi:hypothetical protein
MALDPGVVQRSIDAMPEGPEKEKRKEANKKAVNFNLKFCHVVLILTLGAIVILIGAMVFFTIKLAIG